MSLEKERKKIDEIDGKIVGLLNQRAELAKAIGIKKKTAKEEVFSPAREKELIERLLKKNRGAFPSKGLESIYSEILSVSRNLQKPLTIAFLGPETTFTHMAAIKKFGSSSSYEALDSIKEVFVAVEKGKADMGVVPIENSTEGTVTHTLDLFQDSELSIVGEISLEIEHNLLSNHSLKQVKKLYSHPQALAQCREWISRNLAGVEVNETASTARGAELAGLYHSSAAIASSLAAEKYKLKVLAKDIGDNPNNFTRFLIIGRTPPKPTGRDKTSIMFSVKNRPGTLFSALKSFHDHNINLSKIESRPTKRKTWEYVFYVDMQGYVEDKGIAAALEEMKKHCGFLKVLGSYPEEAVSE